MTRTGVSDARPKIRVGDGQMRVRRTAVTHLTIPIRHKCHDKSRRKS